MPRSFTLKTNALRKSAGEKTLAVHNWLQKLINLLEICYQVPSHIWNDAHCPVSMCIVIVLQAVYQPAQNGFVTAGSCWWDKLQDDVCGLTKSCFLSVFFVSWIHYCSCAQHSKQHWWFKQHRWMIQYAEALPLCSVKAIMGLSLITPGCIRTLSLIFNLIFNYISFMHFLFSSLYFF